MGFARLTFAAAALLTVTGCHSAFVDATLRNHTDQPLSLVELDYPSASFGTQTLAPGGELKYRFKVLGSGELKLIYTDNARQEHTIAGPKLGDGDEGSLTVTVEPEGVRWQPIFKGRNKNDFPIVPN